MTSKNILTIATAALLAIPANSSAKSESLPPAERANWYLVDEIIRDEPEDFRSEIYFANKASIARGEEEVTIAISRIAMTEGQNRSWEENIRDMRSNMWIDCQTRNYRLLDQSTYDGTERLIVSKNSEELQKNPEPSVTDDGFGAIVRFVCEAGDKIGEQQSPADVQPLTWLRAYLQADWSK